MCLEEVCAHDGSAKPYHVRRCILYGYCIPMDDLRAMQVQVPIWGKQWYSELQQDNPQDRVWYCAVVAVFLDECLMKPCARVAG